MDIGSERLDGKQTDQIDDSLEVRLVDQIGVFLERICTIGHTIEDRLRGHAVDEIFG